MLGALLQSGWGVAPSVLTQTLTLTLTLTLILTLTLTLTTLTPTQDVAWNAARNASEPSLLWAVGRTPFGPYSARAELSFALRDAAARTALHARAAEVVA